MQILFAKQWDRLEKRIERERRLDKPLYTLSRVLWPYTESKLVFYVCILAVLDYLSTFSALELSGNSQVAEEGLVAKWALQSGGFPKLILTDLFSISILISLALGVKFLYVKNGLKGFGRAAFVSFLITYFVFIFGVVVNNVLVTFL